MFNQNYYRPRPHPTFLPAKKTKLVFHFDDANEPITLEFDNERLVRDLYRDLKNPDLKTIRVVYKYPFSVLVNKEKLIAVVDLNTVEDHHFIHVKM